jgi:hypothetical protein
LNERDKLFEVLNKFNISAGSSIKETFAEKITLFVYTPEGSYLSIKIYIYSWYFLFRCHCIDIMLSFYVPILLE